MWFFITSFIITIVLSYNTRPNMEPTFPFKNLVVVINTDKNDNKCLHIHHWGWLLCLLLFVIIFNYGLNYGWNKMYTLCFEIIIGTMLAEYLLFGNNIFNFNQDCFTNFLHKNCRLT